MTQPNPQALLSLIRQMQACASRYLEPGAYVDRRGEVWEVQQTAWFANDIIHILDCPEMIEAMGLATDPHTS